MGLDITAYKKLSKVESPVFDGDGQPEEGVRFYAEANFLAQAEGIEDRTVYLYGAAHRFRAGSYGGYNAWREELAKLAGYPQTPHRSRWSKETEMLCAAAVWNGAKGPFAELIDFSDCEGVIGPVVAKKLAADFAEFQPKADAIGDYFLERYNHWRKAFEMAADNGAVDFH